MSSNRPDEVSRKQLHPQAANLARQHVDRFATALILQSKLLAFRRGDDEVQSTHVNDAVMIVYQSRVEGRKKKLSTLLGGGLFGVFVSESVTQVIANNIGLFAVFVVFGLLGLGLMVYGTGQS